MRCKENEEAGPECVYQCISPKCYRKVFAKMIDDEGKLTGKVSGRRNQRFEKCWGTEAQRLMDDGIL
jgi:hypothetical protein